MEGKQRAQGSLTGLLSDLINMHMERCTMLLYIYIDYGSSFGSSSSN